MNFRRKSRILVVCVVLVISGIQGQLDDFMKICDLCKFDALLDCNSTNIFHINMTINCEMTNKMCTLGINECFEGFENLSLHDIDLKHICRFKELSKDVTDALTDNMAYGSGAESIENAEFYEKDNISMSSFYIQPDEVTSSSMTFFQTTLKDELIESSTVLDNQQDEDASSYATKSFMTITTPTESFTNSLSETEGPYADESFNMQRDEPRDLQRNLNDSTRNNLQESVPVPDPPIETVSCFACESSTNEACLGRIEELDTINCPKPTACVSYHSDGNIVRNCGTVIPPEDIDLCRKPTNKTCDICPSAECNKKLWKQCFKCNSKDDPNCALWAIAETVPFAVCPNYNDNCLVRITKDGDTLRDCSPPDVKCSEDELCSICEGPFCNSGVYPPNRLQCIQCQECEDVQDSNNALPCLKFNANEKCFLYVTAKSKMFRGCVSNDAEMQECQNNELKCKTCSDQNGCNSVPLMKEPTISCSKCKSKNDPSCVWQQPETTVSKCVRKFLFYLTETCLTQFDPSSEETVRDCSMDYGVCTSEDLDCHSCSENGCNLFSLKEQQCIQCQSDQPGQVECRNQAAGIQPTTCPKEKLTFENRGCFTLTKGNVTSRGCVANLLKDDLQLCKQKGQTLCEVCTKDLCNNALAPSRSTKTVQTSLLVLFGVFLNVI